MNTALYQAIGIVKEYACAGEPAIINQAFKEIYQILDDTPWCDAMVEHTALLVEHGMTPGAARQTVKAWFNQGV